MNQLQENFVTAFEAFKNVFKSAPESIRGNRRTLIVGVMSDLRSSFGDYDSFNMNFILDGSLPFGEVYVGIYSKDKTQEIRINHVFYSGSFIREPI